MLAAHIETVVMYTSNPNVAFQVETSCIKHQFDAGGVGAITAKAQSPFVFIVVRRTVNPAHWTSESYLYYKAL